MLWLTVRKAQEEGQMPYRAADMNSVGKKEWKPIERK